MVLMLPATLHRHLWLFVNVVSPILSAWPSLRLLISPFSYQRHGLFCCARRFTPRAPPSISAHAARWHSLPTYAPVLAQQPFSCLMNISEHSIWRLRFFVVAFMSQFSCHGSCVVAILLRARTPLLLRLAYCTGSCPVYSRCSYGV